jgi:hypothetical protein
MQKKLIDSRQLILETRIQCLNNCCLTFHKHLLILIILAGHPETVMSGNGGQQALSLQHWMNKPNQS